MKAFYLNSPQEEISLADLKQLGVFYWLLDANKYEEEGKLLQICQERGITYRDFVDSKKIPNFNEKLAIFFEEHIHDDEEIRFFVEGSGFFDVRDGRNSNNEKWIRIHCAKGDLIVLPAGIYHRFAPDENMYFHVMRLFVGDPIWTPWNRVDPSTDQREARKSYISSYLK